MHNLPMWLYLRLIKQVLKHDGYFTTYFHPYEFYELKEHPEYKTLWIMRRNSGKQFEQRLDKLIKNLKNSGHTFITYTEFVKKKLAEKE